MTLAVNFGIKMVGWYLSIGEASCVYTNLGGCISKEWVDWTQLRKVFQILITLWIIKKKLLLLSWFKVSVVWSDN